MSSAPTRFADNRLINHSIIIDGKMIQSTHNRLAFLKILINRLEEKIID
jgi:hypothetical protein